MSRPIRLAYFVSHPIQYQAPLLRYIVQNSDIQLKAFFLSDLSVKGYYDAQFKTTFAWDTPLLEGYEHEFLPAIGGRDSVDGQRPFTTGIKGAIARGQFDAIWLHGYSHHANLRALVASKGLGLKTFVRSDVQKATARRHPLTRPLKEAVLRWTFRHVDGFFAVGQLNKEYYMHYGAREDQVFLMPYAVDNDFFRTSCEACRPKREEFRASLGLDPGRPVILFAGKLTAQKRCMDLVEAYIRLPKAANGEPHPYLVIVGDGAERQALEARAASTGWSSFRFEGFKNQKELPAYFDLCDLFVLVSTREAFGLILNEVMNAGKPIVISDEVGAWRDLAREGENGHIVQVGAIDDLTDRLHRVTSDPDLAHRMGQKSLEIISQWGFKENLQVLQQALNRVLAR